MFKPQFLLFSLKRGDPCNGLLNTVLVVDEQSLVIRSDISFLVPIIGAHFKIVLLNFGSLGNLHGLDVLKVLNDVYKYRINANISLHKRIKNNSYKSEEFNLCV